jgi:hypothetical protein
MTGAPTNRSNDVIDLVAYRYGAWLASHSIGLRELRRDWPEAFENEDALRGYREAWRRKGYATPPGSEEEEVGPGWEELELI